jgi:hypothetical protein
MMVAAIYRDHSHHSHHKASLDNSEVVCGFPHLLRVIHYEIVVLDPEQFTAWLFVVNVLFVVRTSGCSGKNAIAAPFAKKMVD